MSRLKNLFVALSIVVIASSAAKAVVINYGDFTGSNVMYLQVTEDTRASANALFGTPAVLGDTLDFDPTQFTASTTSTSGSSSSAIVDGQLNFTVMSTDASFAIDNIVISESGDYSLQGLGSAQASASVATPVTFTILEVDGAAVTPVTQSNVPLVFAPSGGSYSLASDGAVTGAGWSGTLDFDIAALFASSGLAGKHVTKVEVVLDNTLSVAAADGGSSFIAKKDFNGVVISTVPEPGSLSLLATLALGALSIFRRRK